MAATATAQPATKSPQQPPSDEHLIALILAALGTAATVAAILALLRLPFRRAGVGGKALKAAAGLVLLLPEPPIKGTGDAARWAQRANTLRCAQYLLAASRRLQQAIDEAQSAGEPVTAALRKAVEAERRFAGQHVQASAKRSDAAQAVDAAAAHFGPVLGWRTVIDEATTQGCLDADGKSFRADRPVFIESGFHYPGAVHAQCRCRPQAPVPGAKMLPQ